MKILKKLMILLLAMTYFFMTPQIVKAEAVDTSTVRFEVKNEKTGEYVTGIDFIIYNAQTGDIVYSAKTKAEPIEVNNLEKVTIYKIKFDMDSDADEDYPRETFFFISGKEDKKIYYNADNKYYTPLGIESSVYTMWYCEQKEKEKIDLQKKLTEEVDKYNARRNEIVDTLQSQLNTIYGNEKDIYPFFAVFRDYIFAAIQNDTNSVNNKYNEKLNTIRNECGEDASNSIKEYVDELRIEMDETIPALIKLEKEARAAASEARNAWQKGPGYVPSIDEFSLRMYTDKESIPEPFTGSLTVSKTVAGNAGETDRDFYFTVTYTDKDGNEQTEEFTLKHGETKTFENLLAESTYTVVENDADKDGYETTKTGDTGTIVVDETATASFINTRNEEEPVEPEEPREETPKPEEPKEETPKPEESKEETPKPEESRDETPKITKQTEETIIIESPHVPEQVVKTNNRAPQTGDESNVFVWGMLFIVSAISSVVVIKNLIVD